MNTKVEEALGVLHDQDAELSLYWKDSPHHDRYMGEYRAARTTLAAHIAQQDATIARMRDAASRVEVTLRPLLSGKLKDSTSSIHEDYLALYATLNQGEG